MLLQLLARGLLVGCVLHAACGLGGARRLEHISLSQVPLQVSVMAVNNEIGVVQPLADIGALCRERKVFFHTDAAQVGGPLVFCCSLDFWCS